MMLRAMAPFAPVTSNLPDVPSSAPAVELGVAQTKAPPGSTPCRFVGTNSGLLRMRSTPSRNTPPPKRNAKNRLKKPLNVDGRETCIFLYVKYTCRLKSSYYALSF
jgi:hypothetical protein